MSPQELEQKLAPLSLEDSLEWINNEYGETAAFSTSLGLEDQVITHVIFSRNLKIRIFTLDTGRLFNETYDLHKLTNASYNKRIETYFPDTAAVQNLINTKGPDSFYDSVDNRKECCYIRKVEPLNRALVGTKLWITGIRSEQSDSRHSLTKVEFDSSRNILKYHPLFDWPLERIQDFIDTYRVPTNVLHKKGFPSIGCAPCTRAVQPGEDIRAGRWWWEASNQECGLHVVDGKLVRQKSGPKRAI
ncbi:MULTISPECIES: phosphoadenylyl-sulfate reductase [Leptospira]|uniref:Adenosine 5'-phosphosulfate reductase n=4 Tax=Leptospira borgpetersenii TaxID=174 RepID=M3GT40_LEPBO|nr:MULTISPECIES: phosphoadenylyl-sulfate reductase [Leptospira]EMF97988.1 phosphoadenosine phosphosulfate reductase family protein [Leptospira borgpetersenii str. 200701203]EMO08029.1 phosphoadenosine phosphosulfate reductase family protein [Leptospira borgpetersenii str. Noumea 25]ALO27962.1 phosphoadenosine phosphosulfate reductase family protein [Leptospira borgpetersenii serovar Ballum]ANH02149.1 Phosphoadenylyl-sulfate reductase [Leptospira borgpetersenii str. 4E]EKP13108.1 phosphoadenosi